ncbi:hypothetical protein TNCV_189371 [Trichonephila clavipes]|nr:hypothetical protein TNCV_189371 [Trichonephila clavipes]
MLLYTAVTRPILAYACPVWGYAAMHVQFGVLSTPSLANPFFAPIFGQRYFGRTGRRGMDTNIDVPLSQEEVPVATKKPRIPPFFVSPKGDWRQLVALAKLIAPSFQSQMSGRF